MIQLHETKLYCSDQMLGRQSSRRCRHCWYLNWNTADSSYSSLVLSLVHCSVQDLTVGSTDSSCRQRSGLQALVLTLRDLSSSTKADRAGQEMSWLKDCSMVPKDGQGPY